MKGVGAENPIAWQGSGICPSSSVPSLRLQRAEGRKQVDGTRVVLFQLLPGTFVESCPSRSTVISHECD
jgi:hypothetical protein